MTLNPTHYNSLTHSLTHDTPDVINVTDDVADDANSVYDAGRVTSGVPHVSEIVRPVLVAELVRSLEALGSLGEIALDLERVPTERVDRSGVVERGGTFQLF